MGRVAGFSDTEQVTSPICTSKVLSSVEVEVFLSFPQLLLALKFVDLPFSEDNLTLFSVTFIKVHGCGAPLAEHKCRLLPKVTFLFYLPRLHALSWSGRWSQLRSTFTFFFRCEASSWIHSLSCLAHAG